MCDRATITGRFEEMADRDPAKAAVADEQGSLTYDEVRRASADIASALREVAAATDRLVAVRVGRTRFAPVALLGVLRSGRGYVPIDPEHPRERRLFVRDDCGARLVVTDAALEADEVPLGKAGRFTVAARPPARGDLCWPVSPETAYVIHTSGSTGTPKGCVVRHTQVTALLDACGQVLDLRPADVWAVSHSFSFDFSVWELWGALTTGGTALIVSRSAGTDPAALVALLDAAGVTVLSQTPSIFGFLAKEVLRSGHPLPRLRYVVLGGEAIRPGDLAGWFDAGAAPHVRIVNMYGITETTVHVTWTLLDAGAVRAARADRTPVGVPLPHLAVSLRDAAGREVADGEAGEIWVSGSGVSDGYLGRPELTRERFVVDAGTGVRHYRSGDWAVRDGAGRLHYIGRTDDQVKIRGHRIELREIEAALLSLSGVRQAACSVRLNRAGQKVLSAHVVLREPDAPAPAAARAHLRALLPPYMVPHRLVRVSALPVNANGKLDRAALATTPALDWPTAG
ncbi:amino acid adenylation domain-containing protein [Streptomyces sp. HMX112]|uniref:amino acid adenylation domain-containing protein n=1 Tax=Streptomyces sp. HMX112 TaxID=3390850 RepID=UPI003A803158